MTKDSIAPGSRLKARGKNNGFSLLEVLISVQILLIVLTFSAFNMKELFRHERNIQYKYQDMGRTQERIEQLKYTTWSDIRSDEDNGVTVIDINERLKQVRVSGDTIVLETMIPHL